MTTISPKVVPLLIACCFLFSGAIAGQAQTTNQLTSADTSSPRATLESFIDSCNQLFELIKRENCIDRDDPQVNALALRMLDCLDTSELPPYRREEHASEVAVALKGILDRIEIPELDQIPNSEDIEDQGGLTKLPIWRIPKTRTAIAQVKSGDEEGEYKFSPKTVDRAIGRYKEIAALPHRTDGLPTSPQLYPWYVSAPGHPSLAPVFKRLPPWLKFQRTLGVANWKWPGILLALAVAMLVMWLLHRVYHSFSKRVREESASKYFLALVLPIAAMFVPLFFQEFLQSYLRVRGLASEVVRFGAYLVALLAAVYVIFAAANRFADLLISFQRSNLQGRNAMIHILAKLTATFCAAVVLIIGGQYLGIPVTTLLASAGIGGIAVALAAQDTLKNLFATLTIIADQPCRVGDLVIVDGCEGFVHDIGMRTAKIQLQTGHMLAIPNEQLASEKVENLSRSTHIRRTGEIQLPNDTPAAKVQRAMEIIRQNLDDHECMDPDRTPKVYLFDLAPPGFRIEFVYWYCQQETGADRTELFERLKWNFRAFNSRFNENILRDFAAEGITLVLVGREEDWRATNLEVEEDKHFERMTGSPPDQE